MKEKIEECAKFIRDVLRPKYDSLLASAASLKKDIEEYEQLLNRLDAIPQETEVDLGFQKVFCKATIGNVQHVYVHLAMGFHVPLTPTEARAFIPKRISFLEDKRKQKNRETKQLEEQIASSTLLLDQLVNEMNRDE